MDNIFEDEALKFVSTVHDLSAKSISIENSIKHYLYSGRGGRISTLIDALIVMQRQRLLINYLMESERIYSESYDRISKILEITNDESIDEL